MTKFASILGLLAALALAAPSAQARTLSGGMSGADVVALNARLYHLHFLPSPQGSFYGQSTVDGVIAFQKWEGIARDGVAGPQTMRYLQHAAAPEPLGSGAAKRVEVSISRQVAVEVSGARVIWVLPVSTAMPGYLTPLGRYHVYAKSLDSWSYEYDVWLPYASYFNGGIALHGFPSVPVYPASHGCVRVPLEFAPILYGFDTVGTEVDVLP